MFAVSKPKVSNNNTYRLIIDTVRRKNHIRIRELSSLLHMRIEEVEMYVHKGVNESYLVRVGENNKQYVMARYSLV
jgi:hypothetical protein